MFFCINSSCNNIYNNHRYENIRTLLTSVTHIAIIFYSIYHALHKIKKKFAKMIKFSEICEEHQHRQSSFSGKMHKKNPNIA